jgi:signal transduction histidine kinase
VSSTVPRTFRRESRLFLWTALLLVLFLNLLTLLLFRRSVEWGGESLQKRAGEVLRRVALASGVEERVDAMERAVVEPDLLFIASYDARARRVRSFGQDFGAPPSLPTARPPAGRLLFEWRRNPDILLATLGERDGFTSLALDPGRGATFRSLAKSLTILVPVAGAALIVLAGFYLRSLLAPYDRLLAAAGEAPGSAGEHADERGFLISRFEATIAALSEKERELERLARAEKERADDLETAARTLSRSLPTGLLSVDAKGTVVELNESGREIFRSAFEARGKPYEKVLAEAPDFRDIVAQAFRDGAAVGRREVLFRSGEEERVLGVTATPASGADGRFLGVMALFTDLTEIRRLEARVALARRLADLGEVSAGAAHEFRNAAAAIDGYADLALRHPEKAAEHLRRIRAEAQEMSRVTSDFLLFARPEGFAPEPVDTETVAEAALAETEALFPEIHVARSGVFPAVRGSAVLLRRALANLLRNGVEATPAGRRGEPDAIALAGAVEGGDLALTVSDRGEGVGRQEREKIFLPFYSTKPGGTGFGLAIVARIAELHGGTVEVSARPGGGSSFTLRLPAAEAR